VTVQWFGGTVWMQGETEKKTELLQKWALMYWCWIFGTYYEICTGSCI